MYELEETHTSTVRISNLYVKQEANSNVLLNGMTLHNGTTRNTTEVLLAGEGAEINLCGMAIADKNQHVDNHTSIDHAVPNCTSNELFKYVLDDQSVGALPDWYWCVPMRNIRTPSRLTGIFVLRVMRECTHNLNWKFTRMM